MHTGRLQMLLHAPMYILQGPQLSTSLAFTFLILGRSQWNLISEELHVSTQQTMMTSEKPVIGAQVVVCFLFFGRAFSFTYYQLQYCMIVEKRVAWIQTFFFWLLFLTGEDKCATSSIPVRKAFLNFFFFFFFFWCFGFLHLLISYPRGSRKCMANHARFSVAWDIILLLNPCTVQCSLRHYASLHFLDPRGYIFASVKFSWINAEGLKRS